MNENIQIKHGDSLQAMKAMADNSFDWAIVDPPYGIGESSKNFASRSKLANADKYTVKEWDSAIPTGEYFNELKRVSKNQIIWGWNYFVSYLNECPSYIVWNKLNGANDFADCESAWCSKKGAARVFEWRWAGMLQQNMKEKEVRIHPTQKPVALYKWLLETYTSEGDLILDTHLGSGSIAIACHYMKRKLVGYEIDLEYYENACKRFKNETLQTALW
jgi:site-specific DNA-methyltransferase (adenine-specific)